MNPLGYLKAWLGSASVLSRITHGVIYAIVMLFFISNASIIFAEDVIIYQNVVIAYALMVLVVSVLVPGTLDSEPITKNFMRDIILVVGLYFVFLAIPVKTVPNMSMVPEFTFIGFMLLYYIYPIGYSETVIWNVALSQKIGDFPSSILFGLFHSASYLLLLSVQHIPPSFAVLAPLLLGAVAANLVLGYVLQATRSVFLVSVLHGLVDAARYGFLFTVIALK